MKPCPLFIDLAGRRVLVVGGGPVAERRARRFLGHGAKVEVIAPTATSALLGLAAEGRIELHLRRYSPGDLGDAFLVVSATGHPHTDAIVAEEAKARGCLLNSAGDAAAGDVSVPASFQRGSLQVAVHSGESAPKVAKSLRDHLSDATSPEWSQASKVEGIARRTTRELPDGAFCFIVGAGPGDPGLLSLRAAACLAIADVVLHDRLVDPRVLAWASSDAEVIEVGKTGWGPHVPQRVIDAMVVEKALEDGGKIVVRLKGGDPFVFGRGGEEALALIEAGIPFEVVPGITAGIAGPALAGIPVTHRGTASSVTLVTGHADPDDPECGVDWDSVAQSGTICIYMGARRLSRICAKLVGCGLPGETPVALIQWASLPAQRCLRGTLADIAARAEASGVSSPAVVVVGEAAALSLCGMQSMESRGELADTRTAR